MNSRLGLLRLGLLRLGLLRLGLLRLGLLRLASNKVFIEFLKKSFNLLTQIPMNRAHVRNTLSTARKCQVDKPGLSLHSYY